jgi:hypothetical protein
MTEDELDQAFFDLADCGEYDRILSQMRTKWSGIAREEVRHFVQDASEEVVRRIKAGQAVTNLPGLIRTIADRLLGKYWEELRAAKDAQRAMDRLAAQGVLWRHDEKAVERIQRTADYVRTLVPKLDNENWRRTIYAILEATSEGRQADNKTLAELLGAKPDTVGKWKERAIARLVVIVREEGHESLETVLNPPSPTTDDQDDYDEYEDDEEFDDD